MKIYFLLAWIVMSLTACTQAKQLSHLNELLTLKGYADEKDIQEQWVQGRYVKFQKLLGEVKSKSLLLTMTREDILREYSDPVVKDLIDRNGQQQERWLYRHPIQKEAVDRVYLYFDADGKLLEFEHSNLKY